ncbi:hypothetical protein SEEH1514_19876, partial [Salmonella enterica subsp. enterica serovar Heidelberg str. N1514]
RVEQPLPNYSLKSGQTALRQQSIVEPLVDLPSRDMTPTIIITMMIISKIIVLVVREVFQK